MSIEAVRRWMPLLRYIDPDRDKWMAAIMEVESGGDPAAIGDDGRALGLYQMHEAWWADHGIPAPAGQKRNDPVYATIALSHFMRQRSHLDLHAVLYEYHYDRARAARLKGDDPDRYVARVRAAQRLLGAAQRLLGG